MLPLLHIPPSCGIVVGGLLAGVRLWPAGNVRTYGEPVGGVLPALELYDNENYADLYFLPDSASYTEDPDDDAQGELYKVKLPLLVLGDAPDVSEAAGRLAGGRYLVAFLDGNGRAKLAGTKEQPLKLAIATETGRRATDRNALTFTLAGVLPERAPFYLETALPEPAARRAWSAGFSFAFS